MKNHFDDLHHAHTNAWRSELGIVENTAIERVRLICSTTAMAAFGAGIVIAVQAAARRSPEMFLVAQGLLGVVALSATVLIGASTAKLWGERDAIRRVLNREISEDEIYGPIDAHFAQLWSGLPIEMLQRNLRQRRRSFVAVVSLVAKNLGRYQIVRSVLVGASCDLVKFAVLAGPNVAVPVIGLGAVVVFGASQFVRQHDRDIAVLEAAIELHKER